jgi:hypothetical protein
MRPVFRWNGFEEARDFVFEQVNQKGAKDLNYGYSFMRYALDTYSNGSREGYEEAWLELEKAVLGRFDERIDQLKKEEGEIFEREEYEFILEELHHTKAKAKKLIRPDWLRKILREG